jgi:hypothetical protein
MGFGGERLRLKLVGELPELVAIDARPKTEGVRDRPRRRVVASRRCLAQAGADRAVDGLLEWNAEFARALFQ